MPQNQPPVISVLLPVRNAERTLRAALRSVQKQQGVTWECICVDDHSVDNSWQILQLFANEDRRIRVFRSPGRGIVPALQCGLAQCRGSLIARMDADDAMHPQRLQRQAAVLLANSRLAGLGCRVRPFPRMQLRSGFQRYVTWLDHLDSAESVARERFIECPILHPTVVWRRSTLDRHPYRDTEWPEDYDLVLRIVESGEQLANLPERLHFWRIHSGKSSLTESRYSYEQFARCKAHYLARGPLRQHHRYVLWGYGSTGRRLCRALQQEGKHPCAIVDVHPRRLGTVIKGAPVVPPDAIPRLPPAPLLVSVANLAARAAIRKYLFHLNWQEARDWFFIA